MPWAFKTAGSSLSMKSDPPRISLEENFIAMRLKAEQLEKYLLLTRLLHGRYGLQIALNRLLS